VIHARQERWVSAGGRPLACAKVREALRRVPDIDRALSRLALDRGGPRDLTAIRAGLAGRADRRASGDAPPLLARRRGRWWGMTRWSRC
jgi:DNA mismatch repair protein MutS